MIIMNELAELNWELCIAWLDDCIIYLQECREHLDKALGNVEELRKEINND